MSCYTLNISQGCLRVHKGSIHFDPLQLATDTVTTDLHEWFSLFCLITFKFQHEARCSENNIAILCTFKLLLYNASILYNIWTTFYQGDVVHACTCSCWYM